MLKISKSDFGRYLALFCFFTFLLWAGSKEHTVKADSTFEHKEGMYYYQITDETKREVDLIGIELSEDIKEIEIPGEVQIDNIIYKVSRAHIYNAYGVNQVEKITISETFSGKFDLYTYYFPYVSIIEFLGKDILPEAVYIGVGLNSESLHFPILVPKEVKNQYKNIVQYSYESAIDGDLNEKEITINPMIISNLSEEGEQSIFHQNGLIYRVIKTGKNGTGQVALVNLRGSNGNVDTYLSLPKIVTNQEFAYQLTEIDSSGLRGSKAKIIVIPDSVKKMGDSIFDYHVKLIFLSKNCKKLTSRLFDYESYTEIVFISLPEGVTTIGKSVFNFGEKSGSIILPSTVKSIGTNALSDFRLVTFLNKTPIKNIKSAIGTNTTVKVDKSVISIYKKAINGKAKVVKAKDIIKSSKITLDKTSITLKKGDASTIKAKLTKASNENVYWISSDDSIVNVSNRGVVTGKNEGTAYIVAYTRTSGLHKAVEVTVTK